VFVHASVFVSVFVCETGKCIKLTFANHSSPCICYQALTLYFFVRTLRSFLPYAAERFERNKRRDERRRRWAAEDAEELRVEENMQKEETKRKTDKSKKEKEKEKELKVTARNQEEAADRAAAAAAAAAAVGVGVGAAAASAASPMSSSSAANRDGFDSDDSDADDFNASASPSLADVQRASINANAAADDDDDDDDADYESSEAYQSELAALLRGITPNQGMGIDERAAARKMDDSDDDGSDDDEEDYRAAIGDMLLLSGGNECDIGERALNRAGASDGDDSDDDIDDEASARAGMSSMLLGIDRVEQRLLATDNAMAFSDAGVSVGLVRVVEERLFDRVDRYKIDLAKRAAALHKSKLRKGVDVVKSKASKTKRVVVGSGNHHGGGGGGGGGGGSDARAHAVWTHDEKGGVRKANLGGANSNANNASEQVIKAGWLNKLGGKVESKNWKSRWFVLYPDSIHYFTSDKTSVLKGVIPVRAAGQFKVLEGDESKLNGGAAADGAPATAKPHNPFKRVIEEKKYKKRVYSMTICPEPDGRTYVVQADTVSDFDDWVFALENAFAEARKGNSMSKYACEDSRVVV
jgi:hypothetical protein